ncbi:hypothetical protein FQA39_LY05602 [Lamprigera yunnana]|nr:hypothetical protein FQA39_LY05602 [Lamprigera yunnana]
MKIRRCFSCLWSVVRHPKTFYKSNILTPTVKFVFDTVQLYKRRTTQGINNVKEILLRGTIVAAITALLVWLSIFMYLSFYYVYVPTISYERPAFIQFKPCQTERGVCSYPWAQIQLTKKQQLLMYGQPYKINVELEMPESPNNKELGMFMVCADFRSQNGDVVATSCRSTMLHYRSFTVNLIRRLLLIPFYLFGSTEEKQRIFIELFADYEEHESAPVTNVYLEIQTRFIELYSAKFFINANFSGLRYFMFHWPIFSATIGVTSNLFFIAIICMISWYQLINSEEYRKFIDGNIDNTNDTDFFKGNIDDDSNSSFYDEDASMLQEPELRDDKEYLEERKILEDIKPHSIEQ